jgi:3-phosphoshikimate 1-carboxyvinyltransferase
VAAAGLPGSDLVIEGVGLNPTRTGLLAVLRRAGAVVDATSDDTSDEPSGTLRIRHGASTPFVVEPGEVPGLIDELPALAALATFGGAMKVTGAGELRVKESDRISALVGGLRSLGAEVEEFADGFEVSGARRLTGGAADAAGDHRLAMAFAVAALGADGPSTILDAGAVGVSYPGFFATLESVTG